MGLFDLFKKEKKEKRGGPAYDPKLIRKFINDHHNLVGIIESIQKDVDTNRIVQAKRDLKKLKMELLGHFMEEDIKLYWYLKHYYKDTDTVETIRTFEETIKEIQKKTVKFIDHYTQPNVPLDEKFRHEFEEIVHALSTRIATEESSLYTLYIK